MKEYKVVLARGFDTHTDYVQAESAAAVKKEIESRMSYEMHFEGLRIKEITPV